MYSLKKLEQCAMRITARIFAMSVLCFFAAGAVPATAQNWAEAPGSPYSVVSSPQAIAVTPDGSYLYVLNSVPSSANSVSAFLVSADNTLTEISGSPFAVDQNAVDLATDGRFLYTANGIGSDTVGAFTIDAAGSLTAVSGSPFTSGGSAPQNLEVAPSGEYLVVTNAASDNFDIFLINGTTGALTAMSGSPFAAGDEPQGLSIDPSSTRLIISNCLDDSFSAFEISPLDGDFAEYSGSPFAGPDCPDSSVFNDDGRFLYVDGLNSFNGYSVEGDGTLVELSESPYPEIGYNTDQGVALSWDGNHVFTTGRATVTGENSLVVFEVLPDGNLTRETYSPVPVPRVTFEVQSHPGRDAAFLTDFIDGSVTVMESLLLSGAAAPTIDGTLSTGEWNGADIAEFEVSLPEGGTTEGTLLVANDTTNLYLAVQLDSVGSTEQGGVRVDFDNDADGECDDGDDGLGANIYGITDIFMSNGCTVGDYDTSDGGTTDGAAAGNAELTFLELSHPLDSGDAGRDFALSPGSRVGFLLAVTLCGSTPPCTSTGFPHTNLAYEAQILINDTLLFADGFEFGSTSRWSSTTP
jgi:6-phosphogluconolactonase (cycloisomerase 2 family)